MAEPLGSVQAIEWGCEELEGGLFPALDLSGGIFHLIKILRQPLLSKSEVQLHWFHLFSFLAKCCPSNSGGNWRKGEYPFLLPLRGKFAG